MIDPKKIQRAKDKTMNEIQQSDEIKRNEDDITALLFDGRIDKTRVMLEGESNGKLYPSMQKESHYTVTSEPGGHYVTHFTPES